MDGGRLVSSRWRPSALLVLTAQGSSRPGREDHLASPTKPLSPGTPSFVLTPSCGRLHEPRALSLIGATRWEGDTLRGLGGRMAELGEGGVRGGERALKSREDPWFSAFTKRVPTGRVKMVPEARSGVQGRKRGGRGSEPGGRVGREDTTVPCHCPERGAEAEWPR